MENNIKKPEGAGKFLRLAGVVIIIAALLIAGLDLLLNSDKGAAGIGGFCLLALIVYLYQTYRHIVGQTL